MRGHDKDNIARMIENRINAFTDKWPGSRFGPAHIVVEDNNLEDSHLLYCIRELWKIRKHRRDFTRVLDQSEWDDTMDMLLFISSHPEDKRYYDE